MQSLDAEPRCLCVCAFVQNLDAEPACVRTPHKTHAFAQSLDAEPTCVRTPHKTHAFKQSLDADYMYVHTARVCMHEVADARVRCPPCMYVYSAVKKYARQVWMPRPARCRVQK